mmetsp:Transcript_94067/g.249773  ORF Transcript_94067/g.249773 Transcript_94067/m.249773 type:complete len:346 (+) Transcript_94067:142-1179(+)
MSASFSPEVPRGAMGTGTALSRGWKATEVRPSSCPLRISTHLPVPMSQTLAVPSNEAVASAVPSEEKATHVTSSSWPLRVMMHSPCKVQTLAEPSADPVARHLLSGEYATDITASSCPSQVAMQVPVAHCQSLAQPCSEEVATVLPSGAQATPVTSSSCPANTLTSAPQPFHVLAFLSREPVSIRSCWCPRGAQATDETAPWWGCRAPGFTHLASAAAQISARASCPPVITLLPSGLKVTARTSRLCSAKVVRTFPVSVLQTFAVESLEAVATKYSSLEKATAFTASKCPLNVNTQRPSDWRQIFAVPSLEPVASSAPHSGTIILSEVRAAEEDRWGVMMVTWSA